MSRSLLHLAFLTVIGLSVAAPRSLAQIDPTTLDAPTNFSLYSEAFRSGDYAFALPHLRWILQNNPLFPNNDDRNFRRAITIQDTLARRASDPAVRAAHRDTVLTLMAQRDAALTTAGRPVDAFRSALQRGDYIRNNAPDLPNRQGEVLASYEQAFTLRPDSLQDFYYTFIANAYAQRAVADNSMEEKQQAVEFMARTEPMLDNDGSKNYYNDLRNLLFRSPQERFDFLLSQYNAGKTDDDLVKELFELADRLNNNETINMLKERILAMDPDFQTLLMFASIEERAGANEEAMTLYGRAQQLAETNDQRRDLFYNMSRLRYSQGQTGEAARLSRQALELDRNFGPANFLIGSIIHGSTGSSTEERYALWLAADYYQRAMNDARVANEASNALGRVRAGFPTCEEIFFKNLRNGMSITVRGESTTVRCR